MLSSGEAVTKMMGSARRRRVNSCCRSGPDISGILTSRIRQLLSARASDARNSVADEKARAAKPNCFNKIGNERRTDSSSSMTVMRLRGAIKGYLQRMLQYLPPRVG